MITSIKQNSAKVLGLSRDLKRLPPFSFHPNKIITLISSRTLKSQTLCHGPPPYPQAPLFPSSWYRRLLPRVPVSLRGPKLGSGIAIGSARQGDQVISVAERSPQGHRKGGRTASTLYEIPSQTLTEPPLPLIESKWAAQLNGEMRMGNTTMSR